MENLKIFLQSQCGSRQLLLVGFDVFSQFGWRIDELQTFAALQAGQEPLVILGVLSYPRVAVVDVNGCYVLVGETRKDHKPLGQEVGLEAIARSHVGQVDDYLVRLGVVWFEGEEDVVDEQVTVDLSRFKPGQRRRYITSAHVRFLSGQKANIKNSLIFFFLHFFLEPQP